MPDLTDEDIAFIQDLREKHEDGKVNRRQALGMLGAAGVGAAGGFLGTGSAAADPSTSDSDGNVGLPSDRVDVFAEGIDSNSVSANTGTIDSLDGTDMQYETGDIDDIGVGTSDFIAQNQNIGGVLAAKPNTSSTTTNSTYGAAYGLTKLVFSNIMPTDGTVRWSLACFVDPGTDQIDVRIYNLTDSTVIAEQTGITSGQNLAISGNHVPTTSNSLATFAIQIRNSDNATSVEISQATLTAARSV